MQLAARDYAAHQPVSGTVTVVGAVAAVLVERPPELGDDQHDGALPRRRADLASEARQPLADLVQRIGQPAAAVALVDMGVPAADVDEAERVPVRHYAANFTRRALERVRVDRTPTRCHHLGTLINPGVMTTNMIQYS